MLYCITLLGIGASVASAQWEVREFAVQPGKNAGGDATFAGKFENTRHREIAWYVPGKKADDRIIIIDLSTGDVRWKSKAYARISSTSISVTDIDGDGIDELVFSAQAEATDDPSLYMVKYKESAYTTLAAPSQTGAQSQPVQTPTAKPPVQSTATGSSSTAPSIPKDTVEDTLPLIADNAVALIQYSVPAKSLVRIDIFSGQGDLVRTLLNEESDAGEFSKAWDGTNDQRKKLHVGSYFYKVTAGKTTQARRPVVFSR